MPTTELVEFSDESEDDVECEVFVVTNEEGVSLRLFSMAGFTRPKTMRLRGAIGNQEITALVDSDATHNFFSQQMVTRMGLSVEPTHSFAVKVMDGHHKDSRGCVGNS